MEENKTQGEILKEKLFHKKENGWETASEERKKDIYAYCDEYIRFISESKTEREIVENVKKMAEEKGFRDIQTMTEVNPGDKVYYINKEKSMYLAVIGTKSMEDGLNIIGAHGDSPRLDLKPNPIYEDTNFAYFKNIVHKYGL